MVTCTTESVKTALTMEIPILDRVFFQKKQYIFKFLLINN